MASVLTHLMIQYGKAQAARDLYISVFAGFAVASIENMGRTMPHPVSSRWPRSISTVIR